MVKVINKELQEKKNRIEKMKYEVRSLLEGKNADEVEIALLEVVLSIKNYKLK